MTAQLSRERLEEKLLEHIKHGGDSEEETMIRMLLAGMHGEPVATLDVQSGRPDGKKFALVYSSAAHKLPDDVYYLHAAPPAPVMPGELHPDTQKLVADFCTALAEKLYKAQLKYGYDADWKQDGWPSQCQAHFHQHIAKGDPRDVAAYCAFMWYHGWKTKPAPVAVPDDIDARMKNAGMLSAAEIIAGQPIDAFMKHAGVVDLESLCKWAEMRRAEFLRMQAKYELGDNQKDDMYEWVISHVAAFSELQVNIRAAMLKAGPVTAATVPPHIYRELVNQLRDAAVKYQGCQQLREQLSATLRTVITPAAPEQEV